MEIKGDKEEMGCDEAAYLIIHTYVYTSTKSRPTNKAESYTYTIPRNDGPYSTRYVK